ncbi:PREDICTED: uncharacterized protein LOC106792699, partial [Polistes canadensis]|uniref:uncharacterized protein LOC106792699 n=1 Tax=Polistes canadensis TaxID=91411 RepID=UPI000718C38D
MDSSRIGNPASPVRANPVMNYILKKIKGRSPFLVPFLKVYVDNVVKAIPTDGMDQTLKTFNSVNNKIQFTMELENNRTLFFLDMNIIRNKDDSIVTNWYVKPTSSGRCRNYNSNNPMSKKIRVIKEIKDKVDKLKQSNLVNKIPCECDKRYIEQTKKKLKKKIEQHRNDCKPTNVQKSNTTLVVKHHFKTRHEFKFEDTAILDREDN